jgi:hypothetical protein
VIKTANLLPKQTKDFDLQVVESFDEIIHLTLYGHPNTVNALPRAGRPSVRLATWEGG